MEDASPIRPAGLWRSRFGALLSLAVLGVALGSLLELHGVACTRRPGGGVSVDLTPLLFFAVATVALAFDIHAVRRGGVAERWGRVGLAAISAAAVFGIWAAAEGFFRASGCAG